MSNSFICKQTYTDTVGPTVFKNCVYMFTCLINGKTYIGQTVNSKNRYNEHMRAVTKGENKLLYRAIRKYGLENFKYTILAFNLENLDEMNRVEIDYIQELKSLHNQNGYNLSTGGSNGGFFGEANPFFGKKHTDETKNKISKNHKKPGSISIVAINCSTGEVCNYPSSVEAASVFNAAPSTIRGVVNGSHRHFYNGYLFFKLSDYSKMSEFQINEKILEMKSFVGLKTPPRKVYYPSRDVYCNMGEITTVICINLFSKEIVEIKTPTELRSRGFKNNTVLKVCRGENKSHKQHKFYFKNHYEQLTAEEVELDIVKSLKWCQHSPKPRAIVLLNVDTNESKVFESKAEAKKHGYCKTVINRNIDSNEALVLKRTGETVKWFYYESFQKLKIS